MTQISQSTFSAGLLDADFPAPPGLTNAAGEHSPRRYAVYRNNVFMSLRDALGEAFPAVKKLIGETNFNNVASDFLRSNPPSSPLMMYYGAGFPEYLENVPQLSHIGYLPDIARLEQAMRHAYHAEDVTPADPSALSHMSEAALLATKFVFAPSVHIIKSPWPILSLYNFTMLPNQPKPQRRAEDILITRPEFDPQPHALPDEGAVLVESLIKGMTFGQAIEQAGETLQLELALSLLLTSGAVTQFITNEET